MIRTFSLVLVSLSVAATDASSTSNLRGSDNDALIRRLTGNCDPPGSPIWHNLAAQNGLDPTTWADKLYQACVNDANGSALKTEVIRNGCWSSAVIAPWVGLMTWGNDQNMSCSSNEDCRNVGGKCYYRYLKAACAPDNASMLPECGTVVANPDLPVESSTAAIATTTAAATSADPTTSTATEAPTTTVAATSAAAITTSSVDVATTTEDPCARRQLSTCEPYTGQPDNIWVIIANDNGLDPNVYAPMLYAACIDSITPDANGDLKTGLIRNKCFGKTEVMMFKVFTAPSDLACQRNADCGASTGICYYKKGLASCEKGPLMQPECGTAPVNPIIAIKDDPGSTSPEPTTVAATTQKATTVAATTQEATSVPPTTEQATTVPPTTQEATTVAATTQEVTTVATTPPPPPPSTTEDPCGRRLEEDSFSCDPQQFEYIAKASGLDPIKYTSGLYEACVHARGTW